MTNRQFQLCATLSLIALLLLPQLSNRQAIQAKIVLPVKRFKFNIDPKIPLKDMLPVPPRVSRPSGPILTQDLTKIPEVHFQEPQRIKTRGPGNKNAKELTKEEIKLLEKMDEEKEKLLEQTAHQIAKINLLNQNHPDRFLKYLLRDRPDLIGLPFVMGDACRLGKERGSLFHDAVRDARRFGFGSRAVHGPGDLETYFGGKSRDNQARIAAMMQMVTPDQVPMRLGLIIMFEGMKEKEATMALTRMALYSDEKEVRIAALKALDRHPRGEITELLLGGLRYPWPAVAENSTQAMVHLKRTDLVPDLVNFLDEPDPRLPVIKEIKGQKTPIIRELVRINHHRNCLLCHPPGNAPDVTRGVLTAGVPIPGESLSPSTYGMQSPDVIVRADVTYLRQDFSRLQEVPDADPWPKMQRFDFLVRTRILTDADAKSYQAEIAKQKTLPYRQAALTALRALTGRDAEPTASAWRKVLELTRP